MESEVTTPELKLETAERPDSRPALMLLSRDVILAASDLPTEDVHVPEWGGTVRVRALTATERDAFEASCLKGEGAKQKFTTENIRAKLCARTIVDEGGKRLFTDADLLALGGKSAAALDRVYEVAARLSKISKADQEALVKNSDGDPGAGS